MIISLLIVSCTQGKKSPIEGPWQMVSIKSIRGNTVMSTFPINYTGGEQLLFSKNHFLWVGRYKSNTTFMDNFGGGTFKLKGNRLTEEIKYSVYQPMVGSTIRLQWELKNDTATQTWPFDANWQLEKGGYTIQKWTKLE